MEAPKQPESINGGLDTLQMEQISRLNTFDSAEVVKRLCEDWFLRVFGQQNDHLKPRLSPPLLRFLVFYCRSIDAACLIHQATVRLRVEGRDSLLLLLLCFSCGGMEVTLCSQRALLQVLLGPPQRAVVAYLNLHALSAAWSHFFFSLGILGQAHRK